MNTMNVRTLNGTYYEVASLNNNSRLSDRYDTLDDAVKANVERYYRQKKLGYRPEEMIVFKTDWTTTIGECGGREITISHTMNQIAILGTEVR